MTTKHTYYVSDDLQGEFITANSARDAAIEYVSRGSWPEDVELVEVTIQGYRDDMPVGLGYDDAAYYCNSVVTLDVPNPDYADLDD